MTTDTEKPPFRPFALLGLIVLCQAVGGIAGYVTIPEIAGWYHTLTVPPIAPPDFVFAPVWTMLYLLMAVAAWRVLRFAPDGFQSRALQLFMIQLALNFVWSFIFFSWHLLLIAIIEILLLLSAIVLTAKEFAKFDKIAAWMMVPYIAWVSFASILTGWICWINKTSP